MNLRNRGRQQDEDSDGVRQPLLGTETEPVEGERDSWGAAPATAAKDALGSSDAHQDTQQDASVKHLLALIIEQWLQLCLQLKQYLLSLLPEGVRPKAAVPPLTDAQMACFSDLKSRQQTVFDTDVTQHASMMRDLWSAAFPFENFPGFKDDRWKDMGWQGKDPSTDIRAGGLLAVQCLYYMATQHPALFDHLMNKKEGTRSDFEYPFAAAAVNVSYQLADTIKLSHSSPAETQQAHGALQLMEKQQHGFEHIFCLLYKRLDQVWLERKASYMEFSMIMRSARQQFEEAFSALPQSMRELEQLIGVSI